MHNNKSKTPQQNFIKRFETSYGTWVVKHRWWIIAAAVFVVFAAGSGVRFLSFNNDLRIFFSKDNPQLTLTE